MVCNFISHRNNITHAISEGSKRRAEEEPETQREEKRRKVAEPVGGRGGKKKKNDRGKDINRSPWDDIARAPMPAGIRGWVETMKVMKSKLHATGREGYQDAAKIPGLKPHHRWAVAPDAAMFASIARVETQAAAFLAYCKIRDVIRFRADSTTDILAESANIEPQSWRYILGFLILAADNDNSQSAKKRTAAFEELQKTMSAMGVQVRFGNLHRCFSNCY